METSLRYSSAAKSLKIHAKQNLVIDPDTFFQIRAELDTKLGSPNYLCAMLRRIYDQPQLSSRFGLGVQYDKFQKLGYIVRGKMEFPVTSNDDNSIRFVVKGRSDIDKEFKQRRSKGGAEFTWSINNFQKEQDVRFKVGYDVVDKANLFDSFTIKWWFGGVFKRTKIRLEYVGGMCKSMSIEPDKLSWFELKGIVEEDIGFKSPFTLYYLDPKAMNFVEGLKKLINDVSVSEMGSLGTDFRAVDVYVVDVKDDDNLSLELKKVGSIVGKAHGFVGERKKLTPRKAHKGTCETSGPQDLINKPNPPNISDIYNESENQSCFHNTPNSPTNSHLEKNYKVIPIEQGLSEDELDFTYDWYETWSGKIASGEINEGEKEASEDEDDSTDLDYLLSDEDNTEEDESIDLVLSEDLSVEEDEGAVQSNLMIGECSLNHVLSEYENSDDEIAIPTVVNNKTDFRRFKWCVGIVFGNHLEFRQAVTRYAIAQGRNLKICASDKNRLQRLGVRCVAGCPFRIFASWDRKIASYVVKSVDGNHTCQRNMDSNIQFKASWCADELLDVFKSRPHIPSSEIVDIVRKNYRIIITRGFAYKIKYAAHRKLHGSMKQHYSKLMSYLEALKQSSPSSHFTIVTDESTKPPTFQRMFVCFEGLKEGWVKGCKKVLCIDGCFIKTFLGGMLLSAVGRDPNEQMYPLAWAVVEGENNDSWQWFLSELKKVVRHDNGTGWTVISDEHQSILRAVGVELPNAEHRHCARHIYANWNKSFKGEEMKLLFWRCAKAYNEADFNDGITEMEKVNPAAAEAFKLANPRLFCRAYVKVDTKCDVILSNMAETFNNYIMHARSKHLIDMLDDIRTMLMKRIATKREQCASKWSGLLCPKVQAILDKEKEEASNCTVLPSTATIFQVSHHIDVLEVDIEKKTCTCRKWDLKGIPCCHAVASISYLHKDVESFVDECYTKDAYTRAYTGSIAPCIGERHWPKIEVAIDPPPIKIGPGRPRKSRIKSAHEDPKKQGKLTRHGTQMSCSICKSTSHNKRKCPEKGKVIDPTPPPMKRGRGRPRKDANAGKVNPESQPCQPAHHQLTAHPGAIGRGGRRIQTGLGSKVGNATSSVTNAESGKRKRGRSSKGSRSHLDIISTQASTNKQ